MRRIITLVMCAIFHTSLHAASPLYIVDGKVVESIEGLDPDNIESLTQEVVSDSIVALYGQRANYGVVKITLRQEKEAMFPHATSFREYVESLVKWNNDEEAARVIVSYKIDSSGEFQTQKVIESTDSRLRRRVLKALEQIPAWQPAEKNGRPIASEGMVTITLPKGKKIARTPHLVY